MLEDLKSASENLRSALTRYLSVCSNVRSCAWQGGLLHTRPLELADQIRREVDSFSQYESQLQDAKLAIKVARNNVPSIVPINTLPPEILVGIFHMVLTLRPHTIDALAQVCFRWRYITLNACSLWTQVQYDPPFIPDDAEDEENWHCNVLRSRLLDHAKLHLSRSGRLPLQLYLSMDTTEYEWYDASTKSFFNSVGDRMQSLNLSFSCVAGYFSASDSQEVLLSDLLFNSTRGTFTELASSSRTPGFISPSDDIHPASRLCLDLTSEQLDDVLAPIKVLHLHDLFPIWTSAAYHDLVDLRLTGSYGIRDTALVFILRMSPRLRSFHFGLLFDRQKMDSILPVELGDLECLRIVGDTPPIHFHEKVEVLFSLITPGKKALRLFLENQTHPSRWKVPGGTISMKHTKAFVERSNVVELYAQAHPLPLELLSLPIKKHLVLCQCNSNNKITALQEEINHSDLSPKLPLECLYLSNCSIDVEDLRSRIPRTSIQRLVLFNNRFDLDGQELPKEHVSVELSAVCPTMVFEDEVLHCMNCG
ncbi:hypothetical protein FRC11_008219 [Ceratobasidium sp. 423]|nr:hypothetical protein FRC11_008219 [Ceratobasidium sp. 423]